ncbi:MAG: VWA domain-containing protein [Acidobacteria bacterium]|nr:VWA domain-containing protein [Acidobacteriota bacterium]MCA1640819.1 VWA domain-containing protein [Acidobacteriota bacterium]
MKFRSQSLRALVFALALGAAVFLALAPTSAQQQQQQPASGQAQPQATPPAQQKPTPKPVDENTTVDDDEVYRVNTALTNVLFTAIDKDKRFVTTLKKEDVRILEDGVPQEIFTFGQQVDLPLTLAIVIDTSGSQEHTLSQEKQAAREFVDAVLRPRKDEVAVVSSTGETTLEQGLTGSVQRVRSAIDRVEFVPPAGYLGNGTIVGTPPISGDNNALASSTSLWDAVWVTCDEVLSESSEQTRRAIILLTDGVNTSGKMKLQDAVDRALKTDTLVFVIGVGDSFNYTGVDEGSIRKIAERTGGRAYVPRGEEDLRKAFEQIQRELREQYLIAYSPTNKKHDGSFRKLLIEVTNPALKDQKLKLTFRQGYFAKSDAPSTRKRRS